MCAARHLTMILKCIFSSCSPHIHDLQWVKGSLKAIGFQRHNNFNLRMCKNQKYMSPVVQSSDYAPVNVKPHLPQVGQRVGISRGLSLKIVPGVGAFVKHKKSVL